MALQQRKEGHTSLLVAADLKRPAAISQLETLGKQLDIPVYSEDPADTTVVKVAQAGVKRAQQLGISWVIIDTGGRLHIDDDLMSELEDGFNISIDTDDIIDFSSFKKGIQILKKYKVS